MYLKTTSKKIAVAIASVLGVLAIVSPSTVHASSETSETSEAVIEFASGSLSLEAVPDFDFASQTIMATDTSYTASQNGEDSTEFVVGISDLRGTGEGWTLNIALSSFVDENDEASIPGAVIFIKNLTVSRASTATIGNTPNNAEDIDINSDNVATPLLVADEEAGFGLWDLEWANADTTLTVPGASARVGANTATLTWSLENTPE